MIRKEETRLEIVFRLREIRLLFHGFRLGVPALGFLASLLILSATEQIAFGAAAYDEVHPCDEYGANPGDPDRMAPGVLMEEIVPRLAVMKCTCQGQVLKNHLSTIDHGFGSLQR